MPESTWAEARRFSLMTGESAPKANLTDASQNSLIPVMPAYSFWCEPFQPSFMIRASASLIDGSTYGLPLSSRYAPTPAPRPARQPRSRPASSADSRLRPYAPTAASEPARGGPRAGKAAAARACALPTRCLHHRGEGTVSAASGGRRGGAGPGRGGPRFILRASVSLL